MRIFISYRRQDTRDLTGRMCDRLISHFGPKSIFKDVDTIPPGPDFQQVLLSAIQSCDVFLAVIGDRWLSETALNGARRLDDPVDYVRVEIIEALKGRCTVIPVLAEGVRMPRPEDLPDALKPLTRRNASKLRSDPDFHRDMEKLIKAIESAAQSSDADGAVSEALSRFAKAWREWGMTNPKIAHEKFIAEDWNVLNMTGHLLGKNMLTGEYDKSKHAPDVSWDEQTAISLCVSHLMTGYLLDRFLKTGSFEVEDFPKQTPVGFKNAPELMSRWFEGVIPSDWIGNWCDPLSVGLGNRLGIQTMFVGMGDIDQIAQRSIPVAASFRACVLLGIVAHRFLMSGAPKKGVKQE